jgi:hypothetical protein
VRRALPAVLTILAAYADGRGSHGLAYDALIAAIPFAAVSALVAFGAYLDDRTDVLTGLQAVLWSVALGLLVLSCAARAPASQTNSLPTLGRSALIACLGVFTIKACVAAAPYLRRQGFVRAAKP